MLPLLWQLQFKALQGTCDGTISEDDLAHSTQCELQGWLNGLRTINERWQEAALAMEAQLGVS